MNRTARFPTWFRRAALLAAVLAGLGRAAAAAPPPQAPQSVQVAPGDTDRTLVALRDEAKGIADERGVKLSFLPFIAKVKTPSIAATSLSATSEIGSFP